MSKRSIESEIEDTRRKKQKKEKHIKTKKNEESVDNESEPVLNTVDAVSKYDIIKQMAPKEFSLSDFENVEHAIGVIQTQLQRIIDIAPTQSQLNSYLENIVDLQLNTVDSFGKDLSGQILLLARSNKLQLGASLKTLYDDGKLPIFNQIINYDENTKIEGASDVKLIMNKLADSKIKVQNRGVHHDLPPLPEIRDPAIEARVFVHKSYTNGNESMSNKEKINTNNERLEFIGDAVLELIATDMVVERYPDLAEGELSRIRIAVIRNETLEKFARAYGFHKKAELIYKGNEDKQGFENSINVVETDKKYTKLIADLLEAYIGGLYMDRGIDGYSVIKEWIVELYQDFLDKYDKRLGYGIYSNKSKLPLKNHHSFSDDGEKHVALNPLAREFGNVQANTPHCDISQRINLQSKTELYALVGCAIRHPQYEKLAPLPTSFIKDVPKGSTFTVVACLMDSEIIGTGEGVSFKEASFRAAMSALDNRKSVEKYHMLRLMVPKSETRVKSTEKGTPKPEHKDVRVKIESFSPEVQLKETDIPKEDELYDEKSKNFPNFEFPVNVESGLDFNKSARTKLQNLLFKKKIIPEFITTSIQGDEGSTKIPVFKTTLKIKGKSICESLDMSKKQGGNRVSDWVINLIEKYGEETVLKKFE